MLCFNKIATVCADHCVSTEDAAEMQECLGNYSWPLLLKCNVYSPWGICDQQAAEACCKTVGHQSMIELRLCMFVVCLK